MSFSCSVLDIISNVMMTLHFQGINREFNCHAYNATVGVSAFTVISCAMFVFNLMDDISTIASGSETVWLSRLSKATSLITQELPIAICLLIIILCEPTSAEFAAPTLLVLLIKLVSLISGTVKMIKLKFFFYFLPCNQQTSSSPSSKSYEFLTTSHCSINNSCLNALMVFVSLCQLSAICLVIINICICSNI
ncbi:unnamed protein product [Soboliphyme baturini]|uniref:Aa_trans domain-containing protein n=1 Tax=Soboliphyme baturini TaxID=241478 RepID=A0A183IJE8_9BILA|nr:unnamed protein product [Soboliphyme baturini]